MVSYKPPLSNSGKAPLDIAGMCHFAGCFTSGSRALSYTKYWDFIKPDSEFSCEKAEEIEKEGVSCEYFLEYLDILLGQAIDTEQENCLKKLEAAELGLVAALADGKPEAMEKAQSKYMEATNDYDKIPDQAKRLHLLRNTPVTLVKRDTMGVLQERRGRLGELFSALSLQYQDDLAAAEQAKLAAQQAGSDKKVRLV